VFSEAIGGPGYRYGVWIKGKDGQPQYMAYAILAPGQTTTGEIATTGADEDSARRGLTPPLGVSGDKY
jgi:hypothetical protein